MSNEQLLVTLVDDSATGALLAQELVHQVKLKDCVLKAEALPLLDECARKLQTATMAAQTLARRARGEQPPKEG